MQLDLTLWINRLVVYLPVTIVGGVGVGLVAMGLWRFRRGARRAGVRGFCPGPRTRWRWLNPVRWVAPSRCGYDLSGLAIDAEGLTRCPECGSVRHLRDTARTALRWRLERPGLVLVALAAWLATTGFIERGRWIQRLPNVALAATKRTAGALTPERVESEIDNRFYNNSLVQIGVAPPVDWTTRTLIDAWIADLRDDPIRDNAMNSQYKLRRVGWAAIPALRAALDSDDWQQRQLAAYTLREMRADPSEALLRVSVEALKDDELPRGRDHRSGFANANQSVAYLLEFARLAEPLLASAMESGDVQQRWLAACVAGLAKRESLATRAVPVLFEHLGDNEIDFDAKHCLAALCHLGVGATAGTVAARGLILREASARWDDPDQQIRAACDLLFLVLDPPPGQRESERREAILKLWQRFVVNGPDSPLEMQSIYLR